MGMSTRVEAIRAPGDKWRRMKDVYDACSEAGVDVPDEVISFFNHQPPDPAGIVIPLTGTQDHPCVSEYKTGESEGYEVCLAKLPKDITQLRFVNSW